MALEAYTDEYYKGNAGCSAIVYWLISLPAAYVLWLILSHAVETGTIVAISKSESLHIVKSADPNTYIFMFCFYSVLILICIALFCAGSYKIYQFFKKPPTYKSKSFY